MSSRRAGSSRASKALEAAAKLRATREGGGKRRIDEVEEEADAIEDVLVEMDEEQYRELVAKRRAEGGDFVVDDDGEGYEDLGEEEDWTEANPNYSDDEEYDANGRKVAKPTAVAAPKKALTAEEKAKKKNLAAKKGVGAMLGAVPKKKKKLEEAAEEADTDAL